MLKKGWATYKLEGLAAILSIYAKSRMFLSIAMLFHSLPFSVCVCVCVLQGLVMDSQNGFSQKRFFLRLILLIQPHYLFSINFSPPPLCTSVCALVGVYKYVHILWLAGSRKTHFL